MSKVEYRSYSILIAVTLATVAEFDILTFY